MASESVALSPIVRTIAFGLALAFPPTRLAAVCLWLLRAGSGSGAPQETPGDAEPQPPQPVDDSPSQPVSEPTPEPQPQAEPQPEPPPARAERSRNRLVDVEGIGEVYAGKLTAAGVPTTDALLQQGATAAGRRQLAEAAGISERLILEWVNHVDLFRIRGVGEEYADLLEEAGVDSVPELARRDAETLHGRLAEVNREKKLVRQLPTRAAVEKWIAQAQVLPPVVSH
jgi:predicted flap endonuclease-1-like 5' DNA nuclease